jgi:phytoene synthase
MDAALANRLAASVRAADPDRYFSALFAPASARPLLFALYAFNAEVARVAETVREPMLGAIRLEWWRETVEGAANASPRNHDVAKGLADLFAVQALKVSDFEAIIAARAFDCNAERFADFTSLEDYLDVTSGALMRMAMAVMGGDAGPAREAGIAYGFTGLLRSLPFHNARHKLYLPLDLLAAMNLTPEEFFILRNDPRLDAVVHQVALRARNHWLAARKGLRPGRALAALLPAALVPLYLRKLGGRDVPIHRRQMALLAAAMRGKL